MAKGSRKAVSAKLASGSRSLKSVPASPAGPNPRAAASNTAQPKQVQGKGGMRAAAKQTSARKAAAPTPASKSASTRGGRKQVASNVSAIGRRTRSKR